MRIISKTREYYDCIMSYAPEEEPLYVRDYKEISEENISRDIVLQLDKYTKISEPRGFTLYFVFFCGRVYLRYLSADPTLEETIGLDEAIALLDTDYYKERPPRYFYECPRRTLEATKKYTKANNYDSKDSIPVPVELFRYFKAPYFIITKTNWRERLYIRVNGSLTGTSFYKVFDPFTTFQEISMYIGNFLTEPDIAPLTVGSDEILAQQKGFDKQSFRSISPGEAKARRKQNRLKKRGLV